jgi:diacylglycerol kinase (ATP)
VGFKYAFRGIGLLCREPNMRVHGLIGVCVMVAGFLFKITATEWVAVVIACGGVFAAEALNTAIERLADVVSPEYSGAIRNVKDLAAGAVLCTAFAAALTGIIIFLPPFIALFRS